jgi:3-polyprenyl-4-hydroxybenzoate decarboxylase
MPNHFMHPCLGDVTRVAKTSLKEVRRLVLESREDPFPDLPDGYRIVVTKSAGTTTFVIEVAR